MPKAIPRACHMPELANLPSLLSRTILHQTFPDVRISRQAALYRINFTRLVDKAVEEYHLARNSILRQLDEVQRPPELLQRDGRYLSILGFTDHFETCINAVHRVLKLLDRLKSASFPSPLPRQLRREIQALARHVGGMRNAIEHMDEWIQRGEIADGDPVVVWIADSEDGAVVADIYLSFADVAAMLRKLHEFGTLLFPPRPPGYKASIPEPAT